MRLILVCLILSGCTSMQQFDCETAAARLRLAIIHDMPTDIYRHAVKDACYPPKE